MLTSSDRHALRELLNRREVEWQARLRGVSLAAEVDVDQDETHEIAQALGAYHYF